jgi:hypothetical protein
MRVQASHLPGPDTHPPPRALPQPPDTWPSSSLPCRSAGSRRGGSSQAYINISEEEIADDYPLPKQAVKEGEEMDELLLFDEELADLDPEDLPRRLMTDFSVYNAEVGGGVVGLGVVVLLRGVGAAGGLMVQAGASMPLGSCWAAAAQLWTMRTYLPQHLPTA